MSPMSEGLDQKQPTYIVMAPYYNPDNGGGIFMHQLVHTLNTMGQKAFLWPLPPAKRSLKSRLSHLRQDPFGYLKKTPYKLNPDLDTPVARKSDLLPESIVVYPEIVLGNPLGAKNVVRWLLYKPGLVHPYEFSRDEMFFRVGEMADMPDLTGGAHDLFLWKINPIYQNQNRPDRKGACFMVRKGVKKARIPETESAIQVDGLSHEELTEVFNQCNVFYSYDEATLYSQYAAICGCLSIVVPGRYASREAWVAEHGLFEYGIAYGQDDIAHAKATQDLMMSMLQRKEADGLETVKNFIILTQDRFGASATR